MPFVELSREIERIAGCSIREIHDLYGTNAYRRYERRALDETVRLHAEAVIATPGGIVAEPATFNALLASLHDDLAAGLARGAHEPGRGAGRHPADGRQPRGDGRPAPHPRPAAPPSTPRPTPTLDTTGKSEAESLAALRRPWPASVLGDPPGTGSKVHIPLDCMTIDAL